MRNSNWRLMDSQYAGACRKCGKPIAVGASIWWQKESKAVRCVACIPLEVKRLLERALPPKSIPEYKRYTPSAT